MIRLLAVEEGPRGSRINAISPDLPPKAPSFITRVCGFLQCYPKCPRSGLDFPRSYHTDGLDASGNFISASQEGEPVDQRSIIRMPFRGQKALFPDNAGEKSGGFLQQLSSSGKKWAVLTNEKDEPLMVVDTDAYLRSALLEEESFRPEQHCHRPIVIRDLTKRLGHILQKFEVHVSYEGDDVVDRDVVLIWGDDKRIISGADILGRLLSGITKESLGSLGE